ncbi:MAG: 30S ribosomal protein S20 [Cyanobacteriota bacterium]|nr:30S ribosomal protein S20 [Cyanobacteriota bacterium]
MANSKSAIKRIQIAERNRLRNKAYKSAVRTLSKKFWLQVEQYKTNPNPEMKEQVQQSLSAAYKKIDKAVQKGVFHTNNGARRKSRLAKAFKKAALAIA